MLKRNPAQFILEQLEEKMPEALRPIHEGVKSTGKRIIQERFQQFVTREEFEAQQALLQQALFRIQELEKQLKGE